LPTKFRQTLPHASRRRFRREPLAGRPGTANRASIFRNLSRNWDSVDIGRLAVEFEKPTSGHVEVNLLGIAIPTPFTRRGVQ
jgi:hypothetical protein